GRSGRARPFDLDPSSRAAYDSQAPAFGRIRLSSPACRFAPARLEPVPRPFGNDPSELGLQVGPLARAFGLGQFRGAGRSPCSRALACLAVFPAQRRTELKKPLRAPPRRPLSTSFS